MKNLLIILLMLGINSFSFGQTDKKIELSKQMLTSFQKNDFVKIMGSFDAAMKSALTKEKLSEIWSSLQQRCGAFVKSGELTTDKFQNYDIVYILLEFKNTKLKMKTVFDSSGKIAGLFFVPENQK